MPRLARSGLSCYAQAHPAGDCPLALVVAITGGTNIGKSVVFNQLAGENASGVSPWLPEPNTPSAWCPLNGKTRACWPRCSRALNCAWKSPDDALAECPTHLLFWRTAHVPPRLLLLDTPDIDSDVEINWQRADVVRQVADVLIAVLTQQKYNDASVKRFFRKAAAADKPVIVVFNQCDLTLDRDYWPQWLETFASETGARPEYVYVMPYDRAAAGRLALPCYMVGSDGRIPPEKPGDLAPNWRACTSTPIKIRTLRGAGRRAGSGGGRGHYSGSGAAGQRRVCRGRAALSTTQMARIRWPACQ